MLKERGDESPLFYCTKTMVSKDCLIMLQNNGDHSLSSKDDLKRIGRALTELITTGAYQSIDISNIMGHFKLSSFCRYCSG